MIKIYPDEDILFKIANIRDLLDNYPDFLNMTDITLNMVKPEFGKKLSLAKNQIIYDKEGNSDDVYLDLDLDPEEEIILYYESIELYLEPLLSNLEYKLIKQLGNDLFITESIKNSDESITLKFVGSFNKDFPISIDNVDYDIDDYEVIESFNMNELGRIEVINNQRIMEKTPLHRDFKNLEIIVEAFSSDEVIVYSQSGTTLGLREISNELIQTIKESNSNKEYHLQQIDNNEYRMVNENVEYPENQVIVEAENKNLYKVRINLREERDLKIRLIDPFEDDDSNDELSAKSNIDYFFEDDVREIMLKRTYPESARLREVFTIDKTIKEENALILRTPTPNSYNFVKNKLTSYDQTRLYLNRNPYQLIMQLDFINSLLKRPLPDYAPLLRLSESKLHSEKDWKPPEEITIDHYYLLDLPTIEGKEPQQKFVKKALGTNDFAFLEGPPGSGKTTTIIEIIFQLINQNNKVLLAASTHVAIDNVLKRIKREFPEMLGKILPIRIGDQSVIDENIREFQIDNIFIEDDPDFNELVLDSANLVCGTMIGILKHPWFDKSKGNKYYKPIQPFFDYLIIDESSKTTFQEFIIPALFAKHWILVGDIQQLAPYAEQDYLKRYFEKLVDYNNREIFPDSDQKANFFIFTTIFDLIEYKKDYKYNYDKFWFTTNLDTLNSLKTEILKRYNEILSKNQHNQALLPKIMLLSKEKMSKTDTPYLMKITSNDLQKNPEKSIYLEIANVLAIENDFTKNIEDLIPKEFMLLNKKGWKSNKQVYRFQYYLFSKINRFENKIIKLHKRKNRLFERKSDWSSEISWRIIRLHELRNVKNYGNHYEKEVNFLLPRSIDLQPYWLNAYSIALPSILESIQIGLLDKRKGSDSIIKSGFPKNSFSLRHEKLEYQFRMHPEISAFPSKEFYSGLALKDSLIVKNERNWGYNVYPSKSTWINVTSQTPFSTTNKYEASILAKELNKFIQWASINRKPDGENYTAICITYYRGQERILRKEIQTITNQMNKTSNFNIYNVEIVLKTVDKIQGEEADIVFLSLVRPALYDQGENKGGNLGFMDNPNRLNVAITRAKFQLVIIGDFINFNDQTRSINFNHLTNEIKVLNYYKNAKKYSIKQDKGISRTNPITNPKQRNSKNNYPNHKKKFRNFSKSNQTRYDR